MASICSKSLALSFFPPIKHKMITFVGGCAQKFSEALRSWEGGEVGGGQHGQHQQSAWWEDAFEETNYTPGHLKNLPSIQVELKNAYLNRFSS